MNWPVVQRILGLLLMMFSITMLPPILVSLLFSDGEWLAFLEGFGLVFASGVLLFLPVAGVLADRWDRHRVLVITQVLAMLQSAALAALALSGVITVTYGPSRFGGTSSSAPHTAGVAAILTQLRNEKYAAPPAANNPASTSWVAYSAKRRWPPCL